MEYIFTYKGCKRKGAPVGASSAPSLEDSLCHGSSPILETMKGRRMKGLRESRNFRAFTPCGRSGTQTSPFFPKSPFSSALRRR